eukprot:2426434-Karenia_brevis.AAC.1
MFRIYISVSGKEYDDEQSMVTCLEGVTKSQNAHGDADNGNVTAPPVRVGLSNVSRRSHNVHDAQTNAATESGSSSHQPSPGIT